MKKITVAVVCIVMAVLVSVNGLAMENIRRGQKGEAVREVQETLISRGYLDGSADGIFGPKTEAAVLAFQKDNGLDATGIVGEATYSALKGDAAAEPGAETDLEKVFPSWNPNSESLRALVDFVNHATDAADPGYLEPEGRVATFDMDGTILCEKAPVYLDYCLTMYRVLDDPTYSATEEERDAMQQVRDHAYSEGETYKPEGITKDDLVASAFAGMTPAEFRAYVADFADKVDVVGFEGMTYGQSFYRPMIEVIDFLHVNDFDVWMVSACEREVVRALVGRFGIPFDHVVATDVPYVASGKGDEPADAYNMGQDEEMLLGAPLDAVECGKSGKPAAIAREIGKRPVLAFGNSTGDYSMLNYAQGNPDHAGMGFFIVCDDTEREYGSAEKAAAFYENAADEGWTAISMVNDWKTIYGDGVKKTGLPGAQEAPSDLAGDARPGTDYADADNWAYFGIGEDKAADVFPVCPTVDMNDEFNMSLEDADTKAGFLGALNMECGLYEDTARLYAPYYRQAAMKVYALEPSEREPWLALAYGNVSAAFAHYLAHENEGRPIILAGFSQGADMCYRLLEEYFGDEALYSRLVAVYAIGWPCTQEMTAQYPPIVPGLPEGAYHVYDYQFFFRNLQQNVALRTARFLEAACALADAA